MTPCELQTDYFTACAWYGREKAILFGQVDGNLLEKIATVAARVFIFLVHLIFSPFILLSLQKERVEFEQIENTLQAERVKLDGLSVEGVKRYDGVKVVEMFQKLVDMQLPDDHPGAFLLKKSQTFFDEMHQFKEKAAKVENNIHHYYLKGMDQNGVINEPGDGNCAFHSFADGLKLLEKQETTADELRALSVAWMGAHEEEIKKEICKEEMEYFNVDNFASYLEKMKEPRTFATYAVLYALSRLFEVQITIKCLGDEVIDFSINPEYTEVISLVNTGDHFNLCCGGS